MSERTYATSPVRQFFILQCRHHNDKPASHKGNQKKDSLALTGNVSTSIGFVYTMDNMHI